MATLDNLIIEDCSLELFPQDDVRCHSPCYAVLKLVNIKKPKQTTNQPLTCFAVSTGLFVAKEALMYSLLDLCCALVTNCPHAPTPLHQLLSWQQRIAALSLSEGAVGKYWALCAAPGRFGALSSGV